MVDPHADLVIDEARFEIRRDGVSIPVEPKVFDLIRLLVKNAGRVVSRDELLRALWPGQHVTDASLRRAVGEARRALGPLNRIKTLPRRGLTWAESPPNVPEIAQRGVVGRARELAELRESWACVQGGGSACLFVRGEAGIGKTTLLDTFVGELSSGAEPATTARAGCDASAGLAEPHQVWLRLLAQLVAGGGGRSSLGALRRLAPNWSAQLPGGAPLAAPPPNPRARLLRELAAFLAAFAQRRPLVLVLDDLHAADASSLELLFGLVRLRSLSRVLLLGAYRPHEEQTAARPLDAEVHALRLRGLAHEISLGALDVEDVARFAAARLGTGEQQIAPLAELLHRRSEGNPLFFTALLDGWIERGALADRSPAFAAAELAADLPEPLEAVIGLELAKLGASARWLLAAASVGGLEFSVASAAAAAAVPLEQAARELESLSRRERFVRGLSNSRFTFRHVLPRDALYHGLPEAERRELHLRTAAFLETLESAAPAELARHFELGGAPARALPRRIAAAVSAGARFGYQEATLHLRCAIEALLAASAPGRARDEQELPLRLGLAMALLGGTGSASDAALDTLARAEALCLALGDTARRPQILAGVWNCRLTRAELPAAASIAREILLLAEDGQPGLATLGHLQSGMTLFYQGERVRAAEHLGRVLADEPAARRAAASLFDDVDPGVVARAYLAWLHALEGRAHDSDAARCESVELAMQLASPQGRALALVYSAALLADRGHALAAREEAERALRVADEFGLPQWAGIARAISGYARGLALEGEAALEELEGGIADYHATGARLSTSFLLSLRARSLARLGRRGEASAALEEANAHCERTGERYYEPTLRRLERELRVRPERA